MVHRLRPPWLVAPCIALVCVAVAGCGAGGAASASSGVALTLTAPTTGATVGVHQIVVTGTVAPSNAVVQVAGQPASVTSGTFKRVLWLQRPTTTIHVTAVSSGYAPAAVSTTVHFSSQLAASIIAAHTASVSSATRALARVTPAPAGKARVVPVVRHRSTGSTSATTTTTTTTPPATTTTTTRTTSPSGGSGASTAPPSTTPAVPPAPAPLSQTEIEQLYLQGCVKADGGRSAVPYCSCMSGHLLQGGAFVSPASIAALARELKQFEQTQNIFKLPAFLRGALDDCASKLPTPRLTVTKLPPGSHSSSSAPAAGSADPSSLSPTVPPA